MGRNLRRAAIAAAVTLAAAGALSACAAPGPLAPATPGSTSPAAASASPASAGSLDPASAAVPAVWDWTATDLVTGETVDAAAAFAGKDVILWFWAPWCPTCNAEAPDLAAAATRLPEGVLLVGVPGQTDAGAAEDFIARHGVDGFPQLHDADGSLWTHFDVFAQPVFALVNDDGTHELVLRTLDEEDIVAAGEELAGR